MSTVELEPLSRLERDVRHMAADLGPQQARGLVDLYYGIQDFRIHANNQVYALSRDEEPHTTVAFFRDQFFNLERDIQKALDTYSAGQPLGDWMRQVVGIGPVLAAGLLAHIDITATPTRSALWTFAGLRPGQRYVKGQKRNWNATLKVLCWRIGDSFVKQSFRENCYYGKLYLRRKEFEVQRNELVRKVPGSGWYEVDKLVPVPQSKGGVEVMVINQEAVQLGDQWFVSGNALSAAKALEERTIKDKDLRALLLSGKLPPGQLDMRARRYAVKRFLAHVWEAAWVLQYGTPPPPSYAHAHLDHTDIEPPPVALPKPKDK